MSATSCAIITCTVSPVSRHQVSVVPRNCGCSVAVWSVTRNSGISAASRRQANSSKLAIPSESWRGEPAASERCYRSCRERGVAGAGASSFRRHEYARAETRSIAAVAMRRPSLGARVGRCRHQQFRRLLIQSPFPLRFPGEYRPSPTNLGRPADARKRRKKLRWADFAQRHPISTVELPFPTERPGLPSCWPARAAGALSNNDHISLVIPTRDQWE